MQHVKEWQCDQADVVASMADFLREARVGQMKAASERLDRLRRMSPLDVACEIGLTFTPEHPRWEAALALVVRRLDKGLGVASIGIHGTPDRSSNAWQVLVTYERNRHVQASEWYVSGEDILRAFAPTA